MYQYVDPLFCFVVFFVHFVVCKLILAPIHDDDDNDDDDDEK